MIDTRARRLGRWAAAAVLVALAIGSFLYIYPWRAGPDEETSVIDARWRKLIEAAELAPLEIRDHGALARALAIARELEEGEDLELMRSISEPARLRPRSEPPLVLPGKVVEAADL